VQHRKVCDGHVRTRKVTKGSRHAVKKARELGLIWRSARGVAGQDV